MHLQTIAGTENARARTADARLPGCLSGDPAVRLAYEHSWLSRVGALHPGAAAVLAERIADCGPGRIENLPDPVRRQIADLLPLARSTEHLLAAGGDDRLSLDPRSGLNRYGCAPRPLPELVSFSSCTASSLSAAAFAAAERARQALLAHAAAAGTAAAVRAAAARTEAALLCHFGVADLGRAILTASGTDAALAITALLAGSHPGIPLTSILVSPAETGSGVPLAVQARHFAALSPDGAPVPKGEALAGMAAAARLAIVALRDADGLPLPEQEVARQCEAAILAALPHGRVVLHAIEGSKTGLAAPGRATLAALRRRFGSVLDIVVDACQARVEPELVRWYVEQGFAVLLTGSKFFAAPGFCGVVLLPHAGVADGARPRIPAGIAGYASLGETSLGDTSLGETSLGDTLGSFLCPGLLLRWAAALHTMACLAALPQAEIAQRLHVLGQSVRRAFGRRAGLALVAAPRPDGPGWSAQPSVFTFTAEAATGRLSAAGLRPLYLELQNDADGGPACLLGQPVELGGPSLGGLRIAFSAEQVVGGHDHAGELDHVAGRVQAALVPLSQPVPRRIPRQSLTASPIPAD